MRETTTDTRQRSGTITIGQLAEYAGVTVKAIRHYHKRGLLAEPPRDASGYRRYTAAHAIQLVKVRTLAEAGVPLARIIQLLAAGPDEFVAAVAEIDRTLKARAGELRRSRQRIAQLSRGERAFVSREVGDYLEQLHLLGVSQRCLAMERDLWILMQSVSPASAAMWIAEKREAIRDPEFCAVYLEYDAAFDWAADDPRLANLADRARRWVIRHRATAKDGQAPTREPAIAPLMAASADVSSPAWARLSEIARELASSS